MNFHAAAPGRRAAKGCFVCIVGPSGAGKDTLIAMARQELAAEPAFVFPRRLVTRPAGAFEDHGILSEADFATGVESGNFALSWRAHGLGYALDGEVARAVGNGAVVVCNISRGSVVEAGARFGDVRVVLITAPPEVLAERLKSRGREDSGAVEGRLARSSEVAQAAIRPDLVIENVCSPDIGARQLVDFLRSLG